MVWEHVEPCPIHGDAAATTASAPETPIILKKNQALEEVPKLWTWHPLRKSWHLQMLENPLHDAKIVHHLDERDEEYDRGQLRHMSGQ